MRGIGAARAALAAAALVIGGPAGADDLPLTEVTAAELIEKLSPQQGVDLRGFDVAAREIARPRVDLAIPFAFDSAELTPRAREMLATLAEALKSDRLRLRSFRLAGHTDAVGPDAYNQHLSEARATAAKAYLVRDLGIEPWRLETQGFGEARLLLPEAPDDGRNRRVEMTTLR